MPVLVLLQMKFFIPFIGQIVNILKRIVLQEKITKFDRIDNCNRFFPSLQRVFRQDPFGAPPVEVWLEILNKIDELVPLTKKLFLGINSFEREMSGPPRGRDENIRGAQGQWLVVSLHRVDDFMPPIGVMDGQFREFIFAEPGECLSSGRRLRDYDTKIRYRIIECFKIPKDIQRS